MSKRTMAMIGAASAVVGVVAFAASRTQQSTQSASASIRIGHFRRLGPIEEGVDVTAAITSPGFRVALGDAAQGVQLSARDKGLVVDVVAHAATGKAAGRAVDAVVDRILQRHQETWDAVQSWAGTDEDRVMYLPPISRPTERLGPTRISPARAGSTKLQIAIGLLAALLAAVVIRQAMAFFRKK